MLVDISGSFQQIFDHLMSVKETVERGYEHNLEVFIPAEDNNGCTGTIKLIREPDEIRITPNTLAADVVSELSDQGLTPEEIPEQAAPILVERCKEHGFELDLDAAAVQISMWCGAYPAVPE